MPVSPFTYSRNRCKHGIITFKTKRGRVISFKGKHGASCGPRKKPSTRHLSKYKKAFAAASRRCNKTKQSRAGVQACISHAVKAVR